MVLRTDLCFRQGQHLHRRLGIGETFQTALAQRIEGDDRHSPLAHPLQLVQHAGAVDAHVLPKEHHAVCLPEIVEPHRADRHADDLGNLAITQLFKGDQQKHLPMGGRKAFERRCNIGQRQAAFLLGLDRILPRDHLIDRLRRCSMSVAAKSADIQIAQNCKEPCPQPACFIKQMLLPQRPLNAVLDQIVGKGRISGQRAGETAQIRNFTCDVAAEVHEHPLYD